MGRSIADCCRIKNLNRDLADFRLKRGWSEKRALELDSNSKLIKIVISVAKGLDDKEKIQILEEILRLKVELDYYSHRRISVMCNFTKIKSNIFIFI